MDILAFALTDEYAPFTISFILMCGIGLIEAIGLGVGAFDVDVDAGVDADGGSPLAWLGIGNEMPILIWLTSLLACYTICGFTIQQIIEGGSGAPLSGKTAMLVSILPAFILNLFAANVLHRIMPKTETTAISPDELVGRRGTMLGRTEPTSRGRAKVVDQHGQPHYVPVLPHHNEIMAAGTEILLVARDDDVFRAIAIETSVI